LNFKGKNIYSEQTFKNPSFIKRFSHNRRFGLSVKLISPKNNDNILDYGTGDGHILTQLHKINNNCRLSGFEPIQKINIDKNIKIYDNVDDIHSNFNKICCFEVMEHLTYENQKKELNNMKSLLDKDGILIISVPIENGLSSFFKNIIRILLKQKHPNTSFSTLFKSLFSIPINRGKKDYIFSHIGFYFKDLENVFNEVDLKIEKKIFSPFLFSKSILNSQIFYILKPKSLIKKLKN